jgi:hypothetical protein
MKMHLSADLHDRFAAGRSSKVNETTVSLPLLAKLTDGDTDDVIHAVHEILRFPH